MRRGYVNFSLPEQCGGSRRKRGSVKSCEQGFIQQVGERKQQRKVQLSRCQRWASGRLAKRPAWKGSGDKAEWLAQKHGQWTSVIAEERSGGEGESSHAGKGGWEGQQGMWDR